MLEIAVLILKVIGEVATMAEDIKTVGEQADRLVRRLLSIEEPVRAVEEKDDKSLALSEILSIVQEAHEFLSKYFKAGSFSRACKRKSHADTFADLSHRLTEQLQALHFNVAIMAWAYEDEKDRAVDLEHMLTLLEEMEFNRRGDHNEVMIALEGLRQAERRTLTDWREIDSDKELQDEGHLGTGGFGTVRLAKWNNTRVAVKYLTRASPKRDLVHDLRREVTVHTKLHFDFIVHLYGACTIGHSLCLVMEKAPGGNLRDYLHRLDKPLSYAMQAALLYDISRGMKYLHDMNVLHRDLKSANVLVFMNDRLKLCDFGLAKLNGEGATITSHRGFGTVQWMPPEAFNETPATSQGDVYSFGMVCFEVATGMEPFPGKGKIHVMNLVGVMGERPQLPVTSNPSPGVVLLMKKCWQQDPNKRPDGFDPVVTDLENALRSAGGDPRESSGSSRSEPSNIAKTKDDNSPVIQSAAQQDRRPSNEASRTQTTTVRTFRGAADKGGATSLLPPSTGAEVDIKEESHIRGSKGLIAPFTPEDNRKGGHPWVLSGLKQNTTLLLKTLTVWVASHTIKAIELKLSDDWMSIAEGRSQEHNEVLSFTFLQGESIVRMNTWTNGNQGQLRSGGFEFDTSNGRHFFASAKSRGRKYATELGCGIVVGAHGRAGTDVDCVGFIFIQKAKSVELREISYPDPQTIDISIAQRLVDDMGSENNEIEWDSAGKVVKRVTNVTRILHYTWSKTFESSVEASSLTLKGNLARLSFDEGKWALGDNYLTPIFWEGIADAREEITELHIEAPATQRMTGRYKIVMDEASCIVPFKATMFITTLDDGEVPLLVEGELNLVVFGNMRFCPI